MLYDLSLASEHGRFACVNTVTPKLWLFRKIVRKKCLHPKESHHWLYYIWLSSLASHASIQAKTTKTFTIVLLLFDSFSIEHLLRVDTAWLENPAEVTHTTFFASSSPSLWPLLLPPFQVCHGHNNGTANETNSASSYHIRFVYHVMPC